MIAFPAGSRPFPPSTFIPIYIPLTSESTRKIDCAFGLSPEARTRIGRGDLVSWLTILPDDYEGDLSPCHWKDDIYTYSLHIFRVRNGVRVPLFRVRYHESMANISVQMDDNADPTQMCDPLATRLWVSGGPYAFRCDFSMGGSPYRGPKHPLHLLQASLQHPTDPARSALLPGIVRVLLNEEMARQYANVAGDGPKRAQFSEVLARITCGSIKTWLSPIKLSEKMEAVDGQYLYGLTCVFA
jgi:hypothetical protein